MAEEELAELGKKIRSKPINDGATELVQRCRQLLGIPELGKVSVRNIRAYDEADYYGMLQVLKTEALEVPFLTLTSRQRKPGGPVIFAVAQEGSGGFLKFRSEVIARLLRDGAAVVISDLPGCGQTTASGESRGRTSGSTSLSATAQMLGTTLLGLRLRCLELVIGHAHRTDDTPGPGGMWKHDLILWGESFAPTNSAEVRYQAPYDIDQAPLQAEPLGPTLALLAGATGAERIYVRGGLVSFRSILDSPFVRVPHDIAIPGSFLGGDLDDLAAAALNRKGTRVAIEAPVDGVNRAVGRDAIERAYALTKARDKGAGRLRLSAEPLSPAELAAWLRGKE